MSGNKLNKMQGEMCDLWVEYVRVYSMITFCQPESQRHVSWSKWQIYSAVSVCVFPLTLLASVFSHMSNVAISSRERCESVQQDKMRRERQCA